MFEFCLSQLSHLFIHPKLFLRFLPFKYVACEDVIRVNGNLYLKKCFAEVLQLAASRHNPSTSFFMSFLLSRATQFYTSISRVNLQSLKLQIVSYVYYPCQPLVHREGDYFLKATDTKSGIYSFPPVFSVDKRRATAKDGPKRFFG